MSFFIKQLLAGRDFAKKELFAEQMANFVYVVGDSVSRQCMLVDPAWDIDGIINLIDGEDYELAGALVTHYHPDHVGGDIFDHNIEGLAELMKARAVPVHVNRAESEGVLKVTGLSQTDLIVHEGGDVIYVGEYPIRLLHTPGHTPGSQCFLTQSMLVSGDTLFIGGCGRVDLPGGNAEQMYHSLSQVLAKLPEETIVYPGHNYAQDKSSTIGDEKRNNPFMTLRSLLY